MTLYERLKAEGRGEVPTIGQARAKRDAAILQVDQNADPAWKDEALEAIRLTALRLPEFFCDDVWDTGLSSTREDRALGAQFQKAARNGWIRKTDRVKPSRRSNATGKPVWTSLIFEGQVAA